MKPFKDVLFRFDSFLFFDFSFFDLLLVSLYMPLLKFIHLLTWIFNTLSDLLDYPLSIKIFLSNRYLLSQIFTFLLFQTCMS